MYDNNILTFLFAFFVFRFVSSLAIGAEVSDLMIWWLAGKRFEFPSLFLSLVFHPLCCFGSQASLQKVCFSWHLSNSKHLRLLVCFYFWCKFRFLFWFRGQNAGLRRGHKADESKAYQEFIVRREVSWFHLTFFHWQFCKYFVPILLAIAIALLVFLLIRSYEIQQDVKEFNAMHAKKVKIAAATSNVTSSPGASRSFTDEPPNSAEENL